MIFGRVKETYVRMAKADKEYVINKEKACCMPATSLLFFI